MHYAVTRKRMRNYEGGEIDESPKNPTPRDLDWELVKSEILPDPNQDSKYPSHYCYWHWKAPKGKGKKMSKENNGLSSLVDNVKIGAKQGVVHEGSEILIDLFKKVVGESVAADLMRTDNGKELIKLVTSFAILYTTKETKFLSENDSLEAICSIVIQNSSRNLISPKLGDIKKSLSDLSGLAENISEED